MIYDLTFARLTTTINKDSHNCTYSKKYDATDRTGIDEELAPRYLFGRSAQGQPELSFSIDNVSIDYAWQGQPDNLFRNTRFIWMLGRNDYLLSAKCHIIIRKFT